MKMSLVPRLPRKMHLCRSSSNDPRLPSFCSFWQGAQSLAPATRNHIWTSKGARYPAFFALLISKCASRHNGAHFFDIATSKSGPGLVCLVHFDFGTCFAPQRRALFRHLNFQKWSEPGVFCAFWLGNVLHATTACTFSTSQLPKVVRTWCVLCILTWKCASCHNGVQFFISPLASWLCTRRFSEPTFRPSGATNHRKNTVFRDFPTFSCAWILFLLTRSLLWSSLFYSSLLSDSSRLCFSLSILSEVWLLNFLLSFPFTLNWGYRKSHPCLDSYIILVLMDAPMHPIRGRSMDAPYGCSTLTPRQWVEVYYGLLIIMGLFIRVSFSKLGFLLQV